MRLGVAKHRVDAFFITNILAKKVSSAIHITKALVFMLIRDIIIS